MKRRKDEVTGKRRRAAEAAAVMEVPRNAFGGVGRGVSSLRGQESRSNYEHLATSAFSGGLNAPFEQRTRDIYGARMCLVCGKRAAHKAARCSFAASSSSSASLLGGSSLKYRGR